MLYFYHGTNIDKNRDKVHGLVESLRTKKPDAAFFSVNSENFNEAQLEEYIGGQGLFSHKYIVFLDRLLGEKAIKEFLVEKIADIAESENIFVLLEGKLDKALAGKIEKKAQKTIKADVMAEEKPVYGAFELANAFARRDKKTAWILYRQAIEKGEAPEALQGMLFWKVKTMLLAGSAPGWKREELLATLESLVDVYHQARMGKHEMETGVERVILGGLFYKVKGLAT